MPVDVGAAGDDLLGDAHRRLAHGPPPGWPNSAPRSSTRPSPSASGGQAEPGHAQHREVAVRVEGDDGGVEAAAVGRDDAGAALPRDDVRVGDDEVVAGDEPGALLDAVARLALDQHGRARDATRPRSAGMPSAGGVPGVGRRERVEHLGERLVADQAAEGLRLRRRFGRHAGR